MRLVGLAGVVLAMICTLLAQEASERVNLTGALVTFDPAHQRPITYADKSLEVTLKVGRPDSLLIRDLATGSARTLNLPEEMAQVDMIRRAVDGKIVALGMTGGSTAEVAIVSLSAAKVVDKFLCAMPSLSPDGRYIAFLKLRPTHYIPDVNPEDHYMLYDVDRSAAENRPKNVPPDDQSTVGTCIYPIGGGNAPADNMNAPRGTEHLARSGFFWAPRSDLILFADHVGCASSLILVLADVKSIDAVGIRTVQQPTSAFCSHGDGDQTLCSLLVRKVDFPDQAEPRIGVVFEIVRTRQLKTIRYEISQFQ